MFKWYKRLVADIGYAIDEGRRIERRVERQEKEFNAQQDELRAKMSYVDAVIDYVLTDVRCPLCGCKMRFEVKEAGRGFMGKNITSPEHRLKCSYDGLEIRARSLQECMNRLEEIKNKQKEEKSGE